MQVTLFLHKDSYLHRFDPRAKLLLLLFGTVYVFLPFSLILQGCFFCMLLAVTWSALGFRELFIPIRSIWPIILMVAILTPPFYAEHAVEVTVQLILRFTAVSYMYFLFFRSTEMSHIIMTLQWYFLPYNAALVITMAIRFIPYLGEIYHQIRDAHKLRAGGLEQQNNPLVKVRALIPVLTSVMIYAIKAIPMVSMSLEHRGLGASIVSEASGAKREAYKTLGNGRRLFTHLIISVMIAVIFTSGSCILQ